jgi:SAM-dependent methyltransferase
MKLFYGLMSPRDVARYERVRYGGSQRLINRREMRMVDDLLDAAARGRRDLLVLDVPCGYGRFGEALSKISRYRLQFDRSAAMAARAAQGAEERDDNVSTVICDIRSLPLADSSVDLVLCMRLLHHVPSVDDRAALLAELERVSRESVVVSYYGSNPLHRVQRWLVERLGLVRRSPHPIFFYGDRLFRRETEKAGLVAQALSSPLPVLHAQRLALLRKRG